MPTLGLIKSRGRLGVIIVSGEDWRQNISEEDKAAALGNAKESHDIAMQNAQAARQMHYESHYEGTLLDAVNNLEGSDSPAAKFLSDAGIRNQLIEHMCAENPSSRSWGPKKETGDDGKSKTVELKFEPPGTFHIYQDGVSARNQDEPIEIPSLEVGVSQGVYQQENNVILISGEAYLYREQRLGGGANGGVLEAVNLATGEEVVLKIQMGVIADGEFLPKKPEEGMHEHLVGRDFSPDGKSPLSVGIGVIPISPDSPIIRHALFDKDEPEKSELEIKQFNALSNPEIDGDYEIPPQLTQAVVLVQRKMPGARLGAVSSLPKTATATLDEVINKLEVAKKVIDAAIQFYKDTGYYHMDIRPENIILNGKEVYFIDPGAAGNYRDTSCVGNTYGYSHPDIIRLACEKSKIPFDASHYSISPEEPDQVLEMIAASKLGKDGYSSKHEAYAVRAVMRFMGIDKMIDQLSPEDQKRFLPIRKMLAESNGESNDMTLESMSSLMTVVLGLKANPSSPQSPPPSPELDIPSSPSSVAGVPTVGNMQGSAFKSNEANASYNAARAKAREVDAPQPRPLTPEEHKIRQGKFERQEKENRVKQSRKHRS